MRQPDIQKVFGWATAPFAGGERTPDGSRHLPKEHVHGLSAAAVFSAAKPSLVGIVVRHPNGGRGQPQRVMVSPERGLDGDRWAYGKRNIGDQVSVMNLSVAYQIANGQSVVFFGDNLLVDLDLSELSLPEGSELSIGTVRFRVSAKPHTPCHLFKARFGEAAFRGTAQDLRLRGLFLEVLSSGQIAAGNVITLH